MAVWSKVGTEIEKHDGRKPMLAAAIRVGFAVSMSGAKPATCGIYKRDPVKHPDEPDVLPALVAKAQKKAKARR